MAWAIMNWSRTARAEPGLCPRPAGTPARRLWPLPVLAAAMLCAALVSAFCVVVAYVPSGSMEPGLPAGSLVLGWRGAYRQAQPQCGDVILFEHPGLTNGMLVKRVIALPGQCVEIRAGRVYLDGLPLDEPYLKEPPAGDLAPLTLPEGCYFVLGDNRAASKDSRFWEDPFVRREEIHARVVLRLFPFAAQPQL